MPRKKKIGAQKPPHPKNTTLATLLPKDPLVLQPHVATLLTELANDQAHFGAIAAQVTQAQADNGNLAKAITAATNGGTIEHGDMLVAAETVRQDIRVLKPLVQGILRKLSPDQVPAILSTILMAESKVGTRHPQPPLKLTQGPSGGGRLEAQRILLALVYFFEVSADGTTFTLSGKSAKRQFAITGLAPGKPYWFRVSAFLRDDTTSPYVVIGPIIVT
jgi:hypothetical protein